MQILLNNCGAVDPGSLEDYLAHGGFEVFQKALAMSRPAIIEEVKASKIQGRGGAGFPTGIKWEAVYKEQADQKYVICNADESEIGTFKDRKLMEEDPFRLIETMLIAGYAVGATKGFVYIRGEYPLSIARITHAIKKSQAQGFLGENILGSGFSFDIEVRRGAGAYICGEETALMESIEGKRGEPRNKPPFPVTHGLFGKPTVINNVETFYNILPILRHGGAWYASLGVPGSTGHKLFSISGHVNRPGVYEVPFGVTLRTLLEDYAGGIKNGKQLQAVMVGGAAASYVTPDQLDVPLDYASYRNIGCTLGSGAIIVFDETVDMWEVTRRFAKFFKHESCGKCVPCRIGCDRQYTLVERIARGERQEGDYELLLEISQVMKDASICGLGQTASSPVLSAIKLFADQR
ncbi:NADH-quinone oxidoreductase subunit NuoF [Effusibacillus consociatus]|uniref:NADH-quinone oxidoreductase subunit NuoF n=1 Tax=Effusibacillus consociatus TaxID=1117041 RepID=A0ABV9Q3L7_9BACL